jgi:hypothetical protein
LRFFGCVFKDFESRRLVLYSSIVASETTLVWATFRASDTHPTLIKKKRKFSSYITKFRGIEYAKSNMTNDLVIYGENFCAFLHILGSPSHMTLHPTDPN